MSGFTENAQKPQGKHQTGKHSAGPGTEPVLKNIREALDRDRRRTPISNVQLKCSQPKDMNAVITLRTHNLRDLTLSELHKNSVRVVGKVTRSVAHGQTMSAFENYGMAMMQPEQLRQLFAQLSSNEHLRIEFSDVIVQGPAIQVLPLMVFV